ncbi:glycoside hydrolase family protein [Paenibacillus illinoisensis]
MRKTSTAGIALIKSFEGCRLTAYKPVQTEVHWTIGWGHYALTF